MIDPLFTLDSETLQGIAERETRLAIAEIESAEPFTGARRAIKQVAISLAASIDKGNAKGRAIANEAAQLLEMMRQLTAVEESILDSEASFSDDLKRVLEAFSGDAS